MLRPTGTDASFSVAFCFNFSSSSRVSSLCFIRMILAKVATAVRLAFRMKIVLNPFVYPLLRIKLAMSPEMPSVFGELSWEGSSITDMTIEDESPMVCIADRNELFLYYMSNICENM